MLRSAVASHLSVLSLVLLALAGCGPGEPDGQAVTGDTAFDQAIQQRWQKPYDKLPEVRLVIISPHHKNIQDEFEAAFSRHHALEHGRRVEIEWPDVGGGSTAILQYLRNVYSRSDTAEIDLAWGGGDYNFADMAAEGILTPMAVAADVLENVPATYGGLPLYDPQFRWFGTCLSGFGFMYNRTLLGRLGLTAPAQWDDLGSDAYHGKVCLADPTQSGTATVINEMIVQSAGDWPAGWAKLLRILSNAKQFFDSSSAAVRAPVIGLAPVATCIDFYGMTRVNEAPEDLVYVSPKGQTAYTPDPIAILKNPPHPELAQRFAAFVLSRQGQALWALPPGTPDGPQRLVLGRPPVRTDIYTDYADQLPAWLNNPYAEAGQEMQVDQEMLKNRFGVLQKLVRAAAIDNLDGLQKARAALIARPSPDRWAEFNRLPGNIDTRAKVLEIARQLDNPTQAELIVTGWVDFFAEKYRRLTQ